MAHVIPITLEGDNLGQRHKYFNQRVNDAVNQDLSFETIIHLQENSILDRFFKVDLASKYKNVDYIVENLKSTNMLYVKRALKSTWLITELHYANIINPDYLETELFPKMLTTAVNEMMHYIYVHLKDETRCLLFYQYYKQKDNLNVAKHFLPHCSQDVILNELELYQDNIKPHYLKVLSEKCPKVLSKYFNALNHNEKAFCNFKSNRDKYFNISKFILKLDPDEYFYIIEKYYDRTYLRKTLSSNATSIIMQNHKARYLAKPELYAGVILDLPTLAQCLDEEEAKDLVVKLARAEYLRRWFTLTYKTAEPLLKRISKENKPEFVQKIFKEKDFGSTINEAPYPFPSSPAINSDKSIFSDFKNAKLCRSACAMQLKARRDLIMCDMVPMCDNMLSGQIGRLKITLLDELFDKYRFVGFSKTFYELKTRLQVESSHQNRLMILNVLVSKTLKRSKNIKILLEHVSSKHANEPATLRASFLRSLVRRAAAYRLPPESWMMFSEMVLNVTLRSEEEVPCEEGIHAILIHNALNDVDTPSEMGDAFIKAFNPLVEYDLNAVEKHKVYRCLYNLLIQKSKSNLLENKIEETIDMVQKLFVLLAAHKVHIKNCYEILEVIKEVVERDNKQSETVLLQLYKMKACRKMFTKENFNLIQDDASYLNVLRHDASLLTTTSKFNDLVSKGEIKHDKFLFKLRVYFEELAEQYLLIIRNRIKVERVDKVSLNLSRGLCILEQRAVLWTFMRDLHLGGKKTQRLRQRIAANIHKALSVVDHVQYDKNFCVIATTNVLKSLPADVCRRHIPTLMEDPLRRSAVRLAIVLTFEKLLPSDILELASQISQNCKPNLKKSLLLKMHKYLCLHTKDFNIAIWHEMKKLILEICTEDSKVRSTLLDVTNVPEAIKLDYCVTMIIISYSDDSKLMNWNFSTMLFYVSNNLDTLDNNTVLQIVRPILKKKKLNEKSKTFGHHLRPNLPYLEIIARFLLICETDDIQEERFKIIGVPLLMIIKDSWNEKEHNYYFVRDYFNQFLNNLRYNKAFLNTKYVSCLPVFEKILKYMHGFLEMTKYFQLYSRVHLTMVYYKTIRQIVKQKPALLDKTADKYEVAAVVGEVFGRYLAREHGHLVAAYFPTISHLYVEDVVNYFRSGFGSGDVELRFKVSIAKSLVCDNEDKNGLFFATLLLRETGLFTRHQLRTEGQEIYKVLKESGDSQVLCYLNYKV